MRPQNQSKKGAICGTISEVFSLKESNYQGFSTDRKENLRRGVNRKTVMFHKSVVEGGV